MIGNSNALTSGQSRAIKEIILFFCVSTKIFFGLARKGKVQPSDNLDAGLSLPSALCRQTLTLVNFSAHVWLIEGAIRSMCPH